MSLRAARSVSVAGRECRNRARPHYSSLSHWPSGYVASQTAIQKHTQVLGSATIMVADHCKVFLEKPKLEPKWLHALGSHDRAPDNYRIFVLLNADLFHNASRERHEQTKACRPLSKCIVRQTRPWRPFLKMHRKKDPTRACRTPKMHRGKDQTQPCRPF